MILLVVGLSIVAYGYMQAELNKAWRALPGAAIQPGAPAPGQIEQPAAPQPAEPERPAGQ